MQCNNLFIIKIRASALALVDIPELTAEEIGMKSMNIASRMCIYTNNSFTTLKL
jgi:ATP-dependent protease HslVU (ClpYQ) peptidase subunit